MLEISLLGQDLQTSMEKSIRVCVCYKVMGHSHMKQGLAIPPHPRQIVQVVNRQLTGNVATLS